MERKNLVIMALCVCIGIMAVAYAAFTTTLNVNGTINASGTFAVTFTAPGANACVATTTVGSDTPSGTVTATAGTTTATLTAQLYTPGDVVTCTIPVKNTGTLQAKYVSNTVSNSLSATSTPIAVSVTSSTAAGTAIAANGTSSLVVTIKYNHTGTSQPTTTTKAFTVTANYSQYTK